MTRQMGQNAIILTLVLGSMAASCTDNKVPFTPDLFEDAKARCGAVNAYIMPSSPKTIAFHGVSDGHDAQAKCLREKLKGTDLQQVISLGVATYEAR